MPLLRGETLEGRGPDTNVSCPRPQQTLQNLLLSLRGSVKSLSGSDSIQGLASRDAGGSGQETLAGLPLQVAGEAHTLEIPPETDPEEDDVLERPPAHPRGFNRVLFGPN